MSHREGSTFRGLVDLRGLTNLRDLQRLFAQLARLDMGRPENIRLVSERSTFFGNTRCYQISARLLVRSFLTPENFDFAVRKFW